ncbi:cryptochrome/photolyase family protein [Opitutus terrae]|uniref:Deoxyribodipyrimidine photo-lyase n=1 Tax=Opitutus terrae (strain DSM 11246 / JCM 15787 / PB90-1) TaxID=452637 RepID=B1ZUX6_OPITP|nr:deoxyribodipyrimidine photo-lyase [Opitutus terrae]ACB75946.1 Deoxyribodipyrimidine photo-lyase [Opitutus terrae PB90-1]
MTPTLLWFRQDLRLQDNPALHAALARGGPVIPVYVWEESCESPAAEGARANDGWAAQPGAASRWWLHHSLEALDAAVRERGGRLILRRGDPLAELQEIVRATGAKGVYWNRRYEPAARARDARVQTELAAAGLDVKTFNSALLNEPETILNKQGGPFQVFSAYWRHCLTLPVAAPRKLPAGPIPAPERWPRSLDVAALELRPRVAWDRGLAQAWTPGEASAAKRMTRFVAGAIDRYDEERDFPGCDGTSMLSAALHWGEISPRQLWAAVRGRSRESGVFPPSNGARIFLAELGWREFAYHLLWHFPHTIEQPLRRAFARFSWAEDPEGRRLRAWQRGQTGYPIVDAGMRQLWQTGWMHNRVRMIVASFLVKHLRLSWPHGATWFWDTLVDADLANNTLGWQWSAGCGADAAPYFRIFAPVLQGRKFDSDGVYVRRWVPELARLPDRFLHAPWTATAQTLAAAGVRLGENYPRPVVDHAAARAEALAAFRQLREPPVRTTLR